MKEQQAPRRPSRPGLAVVEIITLLAIAALLIGSLWPLIVRP